MSETTRLLDDARLRELAAGEPFEHAEAESLLASPSARARLAESDPSALFGALGALDPEIPERPDARALPARPPARAAHPIGRMALGLAAASLALACLLALTGAPGPAPAPVERASLTLPPVVERVQSPTAKIVALVPPSAEGPTVTLILDEEIDP